MKNRGFTLVEMIVSLALFSVVAVIAIGALLKVIDANNKAESIQSAVTNLNFALESMSRDLRTGTSIQCLSSAPTSDTLAGNTSACKIGSSNIIAFYSSRNDPNNPCPHNFITVYAFTGSSPNIELQKAEQVSCGQTSYPFYDIISPTDMTITGYELGVLYNTPGPSYPLAFIRITGNAGTREKDKTYVDLETAVSARSSQ
jgi:prepilin-type N-terminal cleavage/methylation domain-containing protein